MTFKNKTTKATTTKKYRCKVLAAKSDDTGTTTEDKYEITSLTATSANVLTATFASAMDSSDTTITVTKSGSTTEISGTVAWTDTTTATFTATANFSAGTYQMTATSAADSSKTTSATADVEAEKVAEIVITNSVALTNSAKTEAYAYYDVYNQYGDSIRTSTTISWTSSVASTSANKANGKITLKKATSSTTSGSAVTFTYGDSIYLTGVYTKTGVSVQAELTVGMEQSLDTIETFGFVKDSDKSTILTSLPTNFQSGMYVLVYKAYDQNGNEYDVNDIVFSSDVTFISDAPLLIKSEFADKDVYTIDGEEYRAVSIEPGQYVDKGGEVNITAISNKTGNKTVRNYVIGAAALLKSLVLSQPSDVVSDGEQGVDIPYVATDTDGNAVTNYETIVRSTNTLSLTASEGTLTVYEKADGTAGVSWSDRTDLTYADADADNPIDRSIALTTVVVGGESNNLLLQVSDMARPVAVKTAELASGITTAVVELNSGALTTGSFTYVDQYGRVMDSSVYVMYEDEDYYDEYNNHYSIPLSTLATKFFDLADGFDGSYYGVKVQASSSSKLGFESEVNIIENTNSTVGTDSLAWAVEEDTENRTATSETVKYTVASVETSKDKSTSASGWDDCNKSYSVSYSIVPMCLVTNLSIDDLNKQYISLGLENKATGAVAGISSTDLSGYVVTDEGYNALVKTVEVKDGYEQTVSISGSYKSVAVKVPSAYVSVSSDSFDMAGSTTINTTTVTSGCSLTLGSFFSATAANLARKDGTFTLTATIYKHSTDQTSTNQMGAPTKEVTFSDAGPAPTTVSMFDWTFSAWMLDSTLSLYDYYDIDGSSSTYWGLWYVLDQYSVLLSRDSLTTYIGTVSDITENAGEFAHLDNSFTVSGNATSTVTLSDAELGDTFTFTIKATNAYGSAYASATYTLGADGAAYISSSYDSDKYLRELLKYAY